jgi:hypothetical protein
LLWKVSGVGVASCSLRMAFNIACQSSITHLPCCFMSSYMLDLMGVLLSVWAMVSSADSVARVRVEAWVLLRQPLFYYSVGCR